jgi:hypothetical protein
LNLSDDFSVLKNLTNAPKSAFEVLHDTSESPKRSKDTSTECTAPKNHVFSFTSMTRLVRLPTGQPLAYEEKLVGERPFLGVSSSSTSLTQAATYPGVTTPGCATPSGFLNLLTFYSTHACPALFHAESILEVSASRDFPLPAAATAFAALCPSCCSNE